MFSTSTLSALNDFYNFGNFDANFPRAGAISGWRRWCVEVHARDAVWGPVHCPESLRVVTWCTLSCVCMPEVILQRFARLFRALEQSPGDRAKQSSSRSGASERCGLCAPEARGDDLIFVWGRCGALWRGYWSTPRLACIISLSDC